MKAIRKTVNMLFCCCVTIFAVLSENLQIKHETTLIKRNDQITTQEQLKCMQNNDNFSVAIRSCSTCKTMEPSHENTY